MGNNFERYETLLDRVSEIAEACLDMEGGAFFLAWVGELIQNLMGKGYCRSVRLAARKLGRQLVPTRYGRSAMN